MYKHRWSDGRDIEPLPGKAVCIGRNYAEHARELNNPVPQAPLLFIKPLTAMTEMESEIVIPGGMGEVHHEAEIAVLIKEKLTQADRRMAEQSIAGIGAALDLTLRALQNDLKSRSHPWEKAKAFDGSCPLSRFTEIEKFPDLTDIDVRFSVNGVVRQSGNSAQMLFPIIELIETTSHFFTLLPGDILLTGTPAGVGRLGVGDTFTMTVGEQIEVTSTVNRR